MTTPIKRPTKGGALSNNAWMAGQAAMREICDSRNVKIHLVCSGAKTQDVVNARHDIIRVLRSWGWSTPQVGVLMNKHHSMVVYAEQRMREALSPKPAEAVTQAEEVG